MSDRSAVRLSASSTYASPACTESGAHPSHSPLRQRRDSPPPALSIFQSLTVYRQLEAIAEWGLPAKSSTDSSPRVLLANDPPTHSYGRSVSDARCVFLPPRRMRRHSPGRIRCLPFPRRDGTGRENHGFRLFHIDGNEWPVDPLKTWPSTTPEPPSTHIPQPSDRCLRF